MNNNVVILADVISCKDNLDKEVLDNLVQVESVHKSLNNLGYEVIRIEFTDDLRCLKKSLKDINPLFVFNLVEEEKNIIIAPLLLENLGILYTGCPSYAIHFTNNKIIFKELFAGILNQFDIKTPSFVSLNNFSQYKKNTKYIIKAIDKNSSVDLDDNSVIIPKSKDHLKELLLQKKIKNDYDFFAEEYIDGREFNAAVLNGECLPVSEIIFKDYPENKVKIVGYSAKWDSDSFEYSNTVRNYNFDENDKHIINKIKNIQKICGGYLKINGYHRLDFRVDINNTPYLLEINANPCISNDAGFYAACSLQGYTYDQMIKLIIEEMYTHKSVNIKTKV